MIPLGATTLATPEIGVPDLCGRFRAALKFASAKPSSAAARTDPELHDNYSSCRRFHGAAGVPRAVAPAPIVTIINPGVTIVPAVAAEILSSFQENSTLLQLLRGRHRWPRQKFRLS